MAGKVQTVRAKHDTFNRGDWEALAELFAESGVFVDHAHGLVLRGPRTIA